VRSPTKSPKATNCCKIIDSIEDFTYLTILQGEIPVWTLPKIRQDFCARCAFFCGCCVCVEREKSQFDTYVSFPSPSCSVLLGLGVLVCFPTYVTDRFHRSPMESVLFFDMLHFYH
jgi:hypothetical protein